MSLVSFWYYTFRILQPLQHIENLIRSISRKKTSISLGKLWAVILTVICMKQMQHSLRELREVSLIVITVEIVM